MSAKSSKKKLKTEWFDCTARNCKLLSRWKDSVDENLPEYPSIRFEDSTAILYTNCIKICSSEYNFPYVKMTLETLSHLGLSIGSYCFLKSSESVFSGVFSCLPSVDVAPGELIVSHQKPKLISLQGIVFSLQSVNASDIQEASQINVCVTSTNETLGQLTLELFEEFLSHILLNRVLFTGQFVNLRVYSLDFDAKIEEWLPSDNGLSNVSDLLSQRPTVNRWAKVTEHTKFSVRLSFKTGDACYPLSLPKLYDFAGYEDLICTVRSEIVESFLKVPRVASCQGILFYGTSGVGKTFFVTSLIGELGVSQENVFYDMKVPTNLRSDQNVIFFFDDLHFILGGHAKIRTDVTDGQSALQKIRHFFDELRKRNISCHIIGTTTDIETVDLSLRRVGYFEHEYEIVPPTQKCRFKILSKLAEKDFANLKFKETELELLSHDAHGYIASDLLRVLKLGSQDFKDGDEVPLSSLQTALKRVKPSAMKEIVLDIPRVKWADIGGQSPLKTKLKQCIEWPVKNPEKFAKFGIQPPRGILLYGPPGCSKTMIAKALANETGLNFLSVKGPELYDKYVGQSEKAIRKLFQRAKQAAPVIIFFDEIDAIAPSRGNSATNNVSDRVLTQMLTEMDGVEKLENVVIVAATNRPDIIDKALIRPGRIDKLFYVSLPDTETRQNIIRLKLGKMPCLNLLSSDENSFIEKLTTQTSGYSGAEVCALCDEASMNALRRSIEKESTIDDFLTEDDFNEALKFVLPQTSKESLKRYEDFQKQCDC